MTQVINPPSSGAAFATVGQGGFLGGETIAGKPQAGTGQFNNHLPNDLWVVPLVLTAKFTIRKLTFALAANSGSASNHVYFGIYSGDGTQKLVDAGVVATPFNGSVTQYQVTLATSVTLGPGYYLFAFGQDTGATCQTTTGFDTSNVQPMYNDSFVRIGYILGGISGALPASVALGSLVDHSISIPTILFEV